LCDIRVKNSNSTLTLCFREIQDLETLLADLGFTKYLSKFKAQDVDLHVFLTLNEADLKEIGIE